ncbi:MAG: LysM domain-containing protein [Acidobacteriota bacterium]
MNFPPNSRYHLTGTSYVTMPDGRTIVYLKRRFSPPPETLALLEEHVVTQGERIDNIAVERIGDPEQFWRICDANAALHPRDLTQEVGRRIRITLPEGIPGASDAD